MTFSIVANKTGLMALTKMDVTFTLIAGSSDDLLGYPNSDKDAAVSDQNERDQEIC